ncbi:hypothetical protein [Chromobacterium phragmitis]|uniref:Uncharacterized protein n=1 Tax=Chromobacterium phragmitis TaxID=2202141 RepID=A0A344ULC0_9NEIS|nr:hypothetical protein [Chromobacterium phragmitis]AXE36068.1 hypothetical protein DK843_18250 [Chromobacterium phragmitis]
MAILSLHASQQRPRPGFLAGLSRLWRHRRAEADTAAAPRKANLSDITAGEAQTVIGEWLKAGRLTPAESRSLGLAMTIRVLNISYGHSIPERFDLVAETLSTLEGSRNIGCWDQVQALSHCLEVMRAYQEQA